jgi:hypothetical protein
VAIFDYDRCSIFIGNSGDYKALSNLASIEAETAARAARWFERLERRINGLERRPHRAPFTPEDGTLRHLL